MEELKGDAVCLGGQMWRRERRCTTSLDAPTFCSSSSQSVRLSLRRCRRPGWASCPRLRWVWLPLPFQCGCSSKVLPSGRRIVTYSPSTSKRDATHRQDCIRVIPDVVWGTGGLTHQRGGSSASSPSAIWSGLARISSERVFITGPGGVIDQGQEFGGDDIFGVPKGVGAAVPKATLVSDSVHLFQTPQAVIIDAYHFSSWTREGADGTRWCGRSCDQPRQWREREACLLQILGYLPSCQCGRYGRHGSAPPRERRRSSIAMASHSSSPRPRRQPRFRAATAILVLVGPSVPTPMLFDRCRGVGIQGGCHAWRTSPIGSRGTRSRCPGLGAERGRTPWYSVK